MIENEKHIKELYNLKHFNDNNINRGYNYEDNLLQKIMSNVLFNNPTMNKFLKKLQKLLIWNMEMNLIIRNFFNHCVDKFENKHNN
jgi:hypothetical protein